MSWSNSKGQAINNWELYQFFSFRDDNNSVEYVPTSDYVDKGIDLREYNQWLYDEEYEEAINNFMYHTSDPGVVFDGRGGEYPSAAQAFHVLMCIPFSSGGTDFPKGILREFQYKT